MKVKRLLSTGGDSLILKALKTKVLHPQHIPPQRTAVCLEYWNSPHPCKGCRVRSPGFRPAAHTLCPRASDLTSPGFPYLSWKIGLIKACLKFFVRNSNSDREVLRAMAGSHQEPNTRSWEWQRQQQG